MHQWRLVHTGRWGAAPPPSQCSDTGLSLFKVEYYIYVFFSLSINILMTEQQSIIKSCAQIKNVNRIAG